MLLQPFGSTAQRAWNSAAASQGHAGHRSTMGAAAKGRRAVRRCHDVVCAGAAAQVGNKSWLEARRALVAALTTTLELIPATRLDLEIDAVMAGIDREACAGQENAMPPLVSPKAAVLVQHLQSYQVG